MTPSQVSPAAGVSASLRYPLLAAGCFPPHTPSAPYARGPLRSPGLWPGVPGSTRLRLAGHNRVRREPGAARAWGGPAGQRRQRSQAACQDPRTRRWQHVQGSWTVARGFLTCPPPQRAMAPRTAPASEDPAARAEAAEVGPGATTLFFQSILFLFQSINRYHTASAWVAGRLRALLLALVLARL